MWSPQHCGRLRLSCGACGCENNVHNIVVGYIAKIVENFFGGIYSKSKFFYEFNKKNHCFLLLPWANMKVDGGKIQISQMERGR